MSTNKLFVSHYIGLRLQPMGNTAETYVSVHIPAAPE
jgi:hypothetical protein